MEEKIWGILKEISSEILTYEGTDMIGEGIIDSFQVIDIVEALEEVFGIEIDAEYVVAENFRNRAAVTELMRTLIGE